MHQLRGLLYAACHDVRTVTLGLNPHGCQGSTCAMVESILRNCGYRTGLYTSPHLCDVRERVRVNG